MVTTVAPADNTVDAIRKKVRRLTASSSEAALSTNDLDQYINAFYNNDFPYAIKLDQMRSVYTFYTSPYIDRYPLDVNYNQGIRAPVYFEGIQGYFFKDRQQFFNMWPRWPTQFTQAPQSLTGNIVVALQSNPCQISSVNHGLTTGDQVTIDDVQGMVQLNGNTYTITVADPNNFYLNGVNATAFTPQVPNTGTWSANSRVFSFTVSNTPFLSKEVVLGGVDTSGHAIRIADDGNGNLQLQTPNPVVTVPPYTDVYTVSNAPTTDLIGKPIPGMHNQNTLNPGLNTLANLGTVNYVTGAISFTLPSGISLASGTLLNVWVSQYSQGRPYTLLFWNNELTIRPVPDNVYKVEVETYLTPVQFMLSTDYPILNQWWQYIAIGAAIKILEDRQDMEGVANLAPLFDRQEALVLERQAIEEIGQRNATIFSQTIQNQNFGSPAGWYP